MELAVSEAKRAGDRGDYPIGAVITRLTGGREVVIASAGNRVKTSGSNIKHVELEMGEYGLAEMIDEHDIAIDLVHLRVEDPAPVG
jgi:tRNA(Arg) A34 adenosine deaminase TadA